MYDNHMYIHVCTYYIDEMNSEALNYNRVDHIYSIYNRIYVHTIFCIQFQLEEVDRETDLDWP